MSETTVGVIGLGIMGGAMSANLVEAGFEVHGYDILDDKRTALAAAGGVPADSAGAVAAAADIVIFSLPNVAALEHVTDEIAAAGRPGLVGVESGTFPLAAKLEARDRLSDAGIDLMDVPLSGTGRQAADATLVVLASGSPEAFTRAEPVFEAIGRSTHYLGDFGNGSVMKYIANLLVTVHNVAAAEAHVLGRAAGLDPELVQEVISDGVGSSKIFDIRGPMMVADDYEPPAGRLDLILKDARIIMDYARRVGAATPLLDRAIPLYEESDAAGLGALDAAAICRFLEMRSGIPRS